jgi:hypothetical protein
MGFGAVARRLVERFRRREMEIGPEVTLGGLLDTESYIEVTRNSAVTLGVNRYPSFAFPMKSPGRYSRLRDIEAPMLGACYLTEWTAGVEQLYETGKEIEVFNDVSELVAKTSELLRHPERRRELRSAGQKRALEDHSIPRTINRILAALRT